MRRKISVILMLIPILGLTMLLSSCAVFTRATEGTGETLENTTEASTDLTMSTSPDGDDRAEAEKVNAFAKANYDRLREDMARGNGEHLASLAHLLGVDENHRADFFALAKDRYPVIFASEPTTPEQLLARLETELDGHPTWRR